jgi:hypothetical protein
MRKKKTEYQLKISQKTTRRKKNHLRKSVETDKIKNK